MNKNNMPKNNYENLYGIEPDRDTKFVQNINSKIEKQSCLPNTNNASTSTSKYTKPSTTYKNTNVINSHVLSYTLGFIFLGIGFLIIGVFFEISNRKELILIDNVFVVISLVFALILSFINIIIKNRSDIICGGLIVSMIVFIIASIYSFVTNEYTLNFFLGLLGMGTIITGYILSLGRMRHEFIL